MEMGEKKRKRTVDREIKREARRWESGVEQDRRDTLVRRETQEDCVNTGILMK